MVKIDAVAKTSKGTVATIPEYKGDASKVYNFHYLIFYSYKTKNLCLLALAIRLIKHSGNGHYIVNYKVPDRVKGFVFIKYGNEEIPGSPFAIEP
uniref:Uncharacterized protein n=1 Tax=Heterorhabditis bacteriophora TaxID=37862 RepID=A0A1I7X7R7_HETBA